MLTEQQQRQVAIVGGTGHLGRRLVDALVEHGYRVTVVGRSASDETPNFVRADALDEPALTEALRGHTVLIDNVSAFKAGGFPRDDAQALIDDGRQTLARAAVAAGIEHVLLISVVGAHVVDRDVPHFFEKRTAESTYTASGLRGSFVRPGMFLDQADGRMEKDLESGIFRALWPLDVSFGHVWTSTVARTVLDELDQGAPSSGFRVVHAVDGVGTATELAEELSQHTDRPIAAKATPTWLFSALTAIPRLTSPGLRNLHAMVRFIAAGKFVPNGRESFSTPA